MLTLWKPSAVRTKENGAAQPATRPATALSLFDEIDRFFDRAMQDIALAPVGWSEARPIAGLATDVSETPDAYLVHMDLPGFEGKDIDVKIEGQTLTVRGERKSETRQEDETFLRCERSHGVFQRAFTLPATIDSDKVDARLENGVLRLTLPKREEARARSITVHVR